MKKLLRHHKESLVTCIPRSIFYFPTSCHSFFFLASSCGGIGFSIGGSDRLYLEQNVFLARRGACRRRGANADIEDFGPLRNWKDWIFRSPELQGNKDLGNVGASVRTTGNFDIANGCHTSYLTHP